MDRLKIDLHIKLERTIKLKYKSKIYFQHFLKTLSRLKPLILVEQIECYQDAGILLTIQDSKFIVRDLFSPDVELPDVIGKCPIFNFLMLVRDWLRNSLVISDVDKGSVKNVSKMGLIVEEMVSSSGQKTSICQLCLVQKKKLLIYYWNKNRFRSLRLVLSIESLAQKWARNHKIRLKN